MSWPDLLLGGLALLAPARCPGCDLACGGVRARFCPACEPLLEPAPLALSPPKPVAAVCAYGGPLADAIRRFKYAGRHDAQAPLVRLLLGVAPHYLGRVDAVVPIPLHAARLRERGYNPAALLSRPLARTIGARFEPGLLRRVRATRVQAGLGASERLDNVRGAFAGLDGARPGRLLLVDDVRTSGATLAAAAIALADQGHRVSCLSLAAVT